jgi:hypothetical protein
MTLRKHTQVSVVNNSTCGSLYFWSYTPWISNDFFEFLDVAMLESFIILIGLVGRSCYMSKLLTSIVFQVSSLQVSQVSLFSHKVASVACCSQVS